MGKERGKRREMTRYGACDPNSGPDPNLRPFP